MRTKTIIFIILALIIGLGSMRFIPSDNSKIVNNKSDALTIKLHKSLTCGCCEVYGSYMRKQGYEVNENNISDAFLSTLKQNMEIPQEVWSCHTSEIDGYIIEGHIPNEAIEKLLTEKPDIKGIGMAGMPSGSPGMPGPKSDFIIYEINNDGSLGELFLKM